MNLRLSLISTVLLVAPALALAIDDDDDEHKVAANAGTGPYITNVQAGFTEITIGPTPIKNRHIVDLFRGIKASLDRWLEGRFTDIALMDDLGDKVREIDTFGNFPGSDAFELLKVQLKKLNAPPGAPPAGPIKPLPIDPNNVRAAKGSVDDIVVTLCTATYELIKQAVNKSAAKRFLAYKLGVLFSHHSTFQFDTLNYSLGEHEVGLAKGAAFLTASELIPIQNRQLRPVTRVGAGVAYGDPDQLVLGLSGAAFLSPRAGDLQMSLSYKLDPPRATGGPGTVERLDEIAKARTLLDHVRAGDLWVAASARWILGSSSNSLSNAQINEFSMTYAFDSHPDRKELQKNPVPATTLTMSGIYCPKREMAIDELGFEFRAPILLHGNRQPIYWSARYGTRGHVTLAIESRF